MSSQIVSVQFSDGALAEVLIQRHVSEDRAVALASDRLRKAHGEGYGVIYAVRPAIAGAKYWKARA